MSMCGLCGRPTEKIYLAKIEGATLKVCPSCASLGNIIEDLTPKPEVKHHKNEDEIYEEPDDSEETVEVIVPNYGKLVKTAREKKGWKQEELAKKIAIKESLLHNIESGHFEPTDEMIHKLEKFLHIKLMMNVTASKPSNKNIDAGPMTLGDMIKFRKKK